MCCGVSELNLKMLRSHAALHRPENNKDRPGGPAASYDGGMQRQEQGKILETQNQDLWKYRGVCKNQVANLWVANSLNLQWRSHSPS